MWFITSTMFKSRFFTKKKITYKSVRVAYCIVYLLYILGSNIVRLFYYLRGIQITLPWEIIFPIPLSEREKIILFSALSHWNEMPSLLSYTQHQTPDPNQSFFFYLSILWKHSTLQRHRSCSSAAPQIRELASAQLYLSLFPTKQNWLQRGVRRKITRRRGRLALS